MAVLGTDASHLPKAAGERLHLNSDSFLLLLSYHSPRFSITTDKVSPTVYC